VAIDLSAVDSEKIIPVKSSGDYLLHDYSKEQHFNYALSSLGGADYLKENYPLVYKLFEVTRQKHMERKKFTSGMNTISEESFSDSLRVNDISHNSEYVSSIITACFRERKEFIGISARLDEKITGQSVGTLAVYCTDTNRLDGEINKVTSELMESEDKEFSLISTFYWLEENADGFSLNSASIHYSDHKSFLSSQIVSSIVLNDPISKNNPTRDYVVVCYDRIPLEPETLDYFYHRILVDNKLELFLPFSGTITLSDNFIALGLYKDILLLEFESCGVVNYNNNTFAVTISANQKQINWKASDDWNNSVDISRLGSKARVNLYNKMIIKIKDVKTGIEMDIPVVIKSRDCASKDTTSLITKPIVLIWGCLGKDTQILMADKTTKKVSDILVGEKIMDETMAPIEVMNIYAGSEDTMISMELESGKSILVTSCQPICTNQGNIAANKLNTGDKVNTLCGYEKITKLQEIVYNDSVYSLTLKIESNMIGNEIYVSDYVTQNETEKAKENEKWIHLEECIKIKEEFIRLFEKLKYID
jgi:hypothetical protein